MPRNVTQVKLPVALVPSMGTGTTSRCNPEVVLYSFGKNLRWNCCVSAVFPTALGPRTATFTLRTTLLMTKTRKADVDSSQDVRSGGVRVELSLQLLDANEPKYKKEKKTKNLESQTKEN